MSLLFEHAIDSFDPASARLVRASGDDLGAADGTVPVRQIAEFAGYHERLAHSEEDWICIPLHTAEAAVHTDEYVAYTDHRIHGPIIVFDDGDGRAFDPVDSFGETRLARRIRF